MHMSQGRQSKVIKMVTLYLIPIFHFQSYRLFVFTTLYGYHLRGYNIAQIEALLECFIFLLQIRRVHYRRLIERCNHV